MVALTALAITTSGATAAHAAPSKDELKKQIEAASNKLDDVTEAYNKTRIDLKATQTDAAKLTASLKPAEAAKNQAVTKVNAIAASSYMTGRVGPMTLILGGNQHDLLERLSYLDQLSKSNQAQIDNYTEVSRTYTSRQAELKATEQKQALQLKELDAQKAKYTKDLQKLTATQKELYGKPTQSSGSWTGPIPKGSGDAGVAVAFAYKQIGKPYGFGDEGPNSYDCSGLTKAAWAAAGHSLPHSASEQRYASGVTYIKAGTAGFVPKQGDLVFYRDGGHVALYVGSGMVIDAPHGGADVTRRTINIMPVQGYGRIS
ncbi:D-gamma-glutamyl-meso-diaminopimelic acid endopeptidase cwlS [Actinoplanes sp. SE50]|nr:D-gamma-glutamyl-meso-diaminopimelic acid endopeptidase cwlS [Actinoplanes sp. SE50]SLL97971.1 D-gamma-glutamyl-meso-diaminopimelic acid endopeptidase [Actinoplanes sp. SE50/110]